MTRSDYYTEHLDEQLDEHGDITPPWAKFPSYEAGSIGWRMGAGETWLCFVSAFLDRLGEDPSAREAYLRRHPPAPHTWTEWVSSVLDTSERDDDDDDDNDDDDDDDAAMLAELEARGLVAADASYDCWRALNPSPGWPWEWGEDILKVARHYTRELSFWSRQVIVDRPTVPAVPATAPASWDPVVHVLRGARPEPALNQGLVALTTFLAAGWPPAPWTCGLEIASFEDSFDDDMGYADAFRLWLMSAFDDRPTLARYLATQREAPEAWRAWLSEQVFLPGSRARSA
ncbi:hypothetical protein ENSA5_67450 [Enhygromyxa salina]|uniref:Uncharacterized protein n=1 Tax=Enhygromyxa salina TaxID=215803 RepID=A0A2S9XB92_9BACT|nr:hypothetical protein [Enhygromyxa salina]PRP90127.1 hypothetical protein ENSA5_67450 [Enhygromyxa salina]